MTICAQNSLRYTLIDVFINNQCVTLQKIPLKWKGMVGGQATWYNAWFYQGQTNAVVPFPCVLAGAYFYLCSLIPLSFNFVIIP